jgi:hypothetical protein
LVFRIMSRILLLRSFTRSRDSQEWSRIHTTHAFYRPFSQLTVQDYKHQVAGNTAEGVVGVPVPDFSPMLQDLKRGLYHLSTNWIDISDTYALITLSIDAD